MFVVLAKFLMTFRRFQVVLYVHMVAYHGIMLQSYIY